MLLCSCICLLGVSYHSIEAIGSREQLPYSGLPWTELTSDENCYRHNFEFFDKYQIIAQHKTVQNLGERWAYYPVESYDAYPRDALDECGFGCRDTRPRVFKPQVKNRADKEIFMRCPRDQVCLVGKSRSHLRPARPPRPGRPYRPETYKAKCFTLEYMGRIQNKIHGRVCVDARMTRNRNMGYIVVAASERAKRRRLDIDLNVPPDPDPETDSEDEEYEPSDEKEEAVADPEPGVRDDRARRDSDKRIHQDEQIPRTLEFSVSLVDVTRGRQAETQYHSDYHVWQNARIYTGDKYRACVHTGQASTYGLDVTVLTDDNVRLD